MAHAEFTGKNAGTTVTYDGVGTGWQKITIAEKGKPLADEFDITHAGDAAWTFLAGGDPLGGKGAASVTVTIDGLISSLDHEDTGLLSKAIDSTGNVIVTTKALGDKFTGTAMRYTGMDVGAAFAAVQPYKAAFSLTNSSGVWSTAV